MCQKLGIGPGVGKCSAPGQCNICKCPTPGTDKVGKCPAVARGGGSWAQVEVTDALALVLISKDALHIKGLNDTSLPNFP